MFSSLAKKWPATITNSKAQVSMPSLSAMARINRCIARPWSNKPPSISTNADKIACVIIHWKDPSQDLRTTLRQNKNLLPAKSTFGGCRLVSDARCKTYFVTTHSCWGKKLQHHAMNASWMSCTIRPILRVLQSARLCLNFKACC